MLLNKGKEPFVSEVSEDGECCPKKNRAKNRRYYKLGFRVKKTCAICGKRRCCAKKHRDHKGKELS